MLGNEKEGEGGESIEGVLEREGKRGSVFWERGRGERT